MPGITAARKPLMLNKVTKNAQFSMDGQCVLKVYTQIDEKIRDKGLKVKFCEITCSRDTLPRCFS